MGFGEIIGKEQNILEKRNLEVKTHQKKRVKDARKLKRLKL